MQEQKRPDNLTKRLNLFNYHTNIPSSVDKSINLPDLIITSEEFTNELNTVFEELTYLTKIFDLINDPKGIQSEDYITGTKTSKGRVRINAKLDFPIIDERIVTFDTYYKFAPEDAQTNTGEVEMELYAKQISALTKTTNKIRKQSIGQLVDETTESKSKKKHKDSYSRFNFNTGSFEDMRGGINGYLNNVSPQAKDESLVKKIAETTEYLSGEAKAETKITIGNDMLEGVSYNTCMTVNMTRLKDLVEAYAEIIDSINEFYPSLFNSLRNGFVQDSEPLGDYVDLVSEKQLHILKNRQSLFTSLDHEYTIKRKSLKEDFARYDVLDDPSKAIVSVGDDVVVSVLTLKPIPVSEQMTRTTRNYHERMAATYNEKK